MTGIVLILFALWLLLCAGALLKGILLLLWALLTLPFRIAGAIIRGIFNL